MNRLYQIFNSFTKTERYIFWAAFSIFLAASALWTIFTIRNSTVEVPVRSSRYQEGVVGQPIAINPILAGTNDVDRDLIELLFDGLINLSENYKVSADGQTWNVILKPDLRWSNGKSLTSDDVIFTIDAIQNSDSRSPLFLTWQGIVVDRISEREVEFTLRTPYAFFLDNLKDLKIIPKHIFGTIPVENFRLSNFNLEPTGNGPYKYISFEKRSDGFITDYLLASNEYFTGEKPYIKELTVRFYQDSNQLLKAFNRKKVDGFGGLNPNNLKELKLGYKLFEKSIPQYYAIFINKNSAPTLANQKILSALNLATDKQKIVDQIFGNKATVINEPILPIINGYELSADPGNEFSIERAGSLLDEEGWLKNEKTGVREKKIGKQLASLEYSIVVPQIPFLVETVNIIRSDWEKIGIKLNPIILNPADIANEVIKTRNYQMIIFGNILRNNPDIFSFWHSSERFYPGLNLALYDNKKVDALLESIRKNPDENSRKDDLVKLQKLISEDKPAIFLYSPAYLYAGPKNLGGVEEKIITTPSKRFQDINKWYLETRRVFK
ncbi:MAG: peptide ABC transporter substrate-binding protein [Candidatus Harrisonbacteria bacterium]|nr:peptide ABC transporter substrate-binding protein [Candidatus Harrisonbacteria bacterium]